MRIIVNARFLLKNKLEGIGYFTNEIIKRLSEKNPDVEFILAFDRPPDPSFHFGSNCKNVQIGLPARHPVLFYLWFEYALSKLFIKYPADLFFSPEGFCSLSKHAPPTLITIHDLAFRHYPEHQRRWDRKYYQYFQPKYAQKAKHIITVSEFSKSDIIKQIDVPAEKISVCSNGVRSIFKPISDQHKQIIKSQYSNGQDYMLYVGSLHPRKNIDGLIRAFDQYKNKENDHLKLLIIGRRAWKMDAMDQAFKTANYQKDIHFYDYVSEKDLSLIMASASIFAYVSHFEGFGVPVLEAARCKVPVISAQPGPMMEILDNAGLFVDPKDHQAIVNAITELRKNPTLYNNLVNKAFKRSEEFNWDRSAQCVEKVLFALT